MKGVSKLRRKPHFLSEFQIQARGLAKLCQTHCQSLASNAHQLFFSLAELLTPLTKFAKWVEISFVYPAKFVDLSDRKQVQECLLS